MKLIKLILILFFLNVLLISAEEFIMLTGEQINYKEIPIKLVSIGTQNSAVIKVGNQIEKISLNEEKIIKDLNIKLKESLTDTIKLEVTPAVECILAADCNDKNPCTENICNAYGECTFPKANGCALGDTCVPPGSLSSQEGKLLYCSYSFIWEERKDYNAQCNYNYECISSLCEENRCTKPKQTGDEKMAPIWLVILFGLLLLLKGILLFASPRSIKNFLREFSYLKDTSYKIIGMFLVVIGAILIIWALA